MEVEFIVRGLLSAQGRDVAVLSKRAIAVVVKRDVMQAYRLYVTHCTLRVTIVILLCGIPHKKTYVTPAVMWRSGFLWWDFVG
jgi:hypothetical protein